MKMKICGIKNIKEIEYMNLVNVDYVGFVFSKSKRKINIEEYVTLDKALRENIKRVGVFRNEKVDFVKDVAQSTGLDIIQLHGEEDKEYINSLKLRKNIKLWKAINGEEDKLNKNINYYKDIVDDILIDSSGGGSGNSFNWDILKNLESEKFIIAGGITERNLNDLLDRYLPKAIDLSSSLEDESGKNINRIIRFKEYFERVKKAYE